MEDVRPEKVHGSEYIDGQGPWTVIRAPRKISGRVSVKKTGTWDFGPTGGSSG
jgi:hypothetical protein